VDTVSANMSGRQSGGPGTSDPGHYACHQQRLVSIISFAYGLTQDQLHGVPDWLGDPQADRFSIEATMPADTTKDAFHLMLQNLLVERFHLRVHHEPENHPAYELVVAPRGPKMKVWTPPATDGGGAANPVTPAGRFSLGFAPPAADPNLLVHVGGRGTMANFARESLPFLINKGTAAVPSALLPRVTDKTGLADIYEYELAFASAETWSLSQELSGGSPVAGADSTGTADDIFNAVRKQLGLRLVKVDDVPSDVVVIDRLDKMPTPN